MIQNILVGIIFLVALAFMARFIFRQLKAGNDDSVHCEKCLPKDKVKGDS